MAGFLFRVWGTRVLVTLLLLSGTYRVTGAPASRTRILAASLISGLYGIVILVFPIMDGYRYFLDIIQLAVTVLIAFPPDKHWLTRTAVYVCMVCAAVLTIAAINKDAAYSLITGAAGFLLLTLFAACRSAQGGRKILYLEHGGRNHPLIGLIDTGNCLLDPLTGESVLVMSGKKSGELVGLGREQLEDPVKTICSMKNKGLCLVPYSTVGSSGLLLAKRFSGVQIDGVKQSRLIAFAPGDLNGFDVLLGG